MVWVTEPAVPVMVKVEVPLGVPSPPPKTLQPATTPTKTRVAATRPRRVRKRRSEAKKSAISKATKAGTTTRMEAGGKKRGEEGGGATSPCLVVRVSVAVVLPPAVGVTEPGAMAQVECRGWPVQVSATAALKVPREVTVMVEVPAAPRLTVTLEGAALTVKSDRAVTEPVRTTVCIRPTPSEMVRVAVSVAVTEGV